MATAGQNWKSGDFGKVQDFALLCAIDSYNGNDATTKGKEEVCGTRYQSDKESKQSNQAVNKLSMFCSLL